MTMSENGGILITLCAVIFSVGNDTPKVLLVQTDGSIAPHLPSGTFLPGNHRSLETGLKRWAEEQTGIKLDYAEQLYTFGNRYRNPETETRGERLLTVSYMALTRPARLAPGLNAGWFDWYGFFPWEDHRNSVPPVLTEIREKLSEWADSADTEDEKAERRGRSDVAFDIGIWNPELVLPRFELLYEAGLVTEAERDWFSYEPEKRSELPISRGFSGEYEGVYSDELAGEYPGEKFPLIKGDVPLPQDHRRILASAAGRLRSKIKYRPLIFELLPPRFTLFQMQRTVETLSGVSMHKQNFRRLLLTSGLVTETGEYDRTSPGRPALLYEFRSRARMERAFMELRYPVKRRGSGTA